MYGFTVLGQNSSFIQLQTGPPVGVTTVNVSANSLGGGMTYYYFVIATYPAGKVVSQGKQISNIAVPSVGSPVTITWGLDAAAISYDENKTKIVVKLPLISVYRMNHSIDFESFGSDPMARRGRFDTYQNSRIKELPVNIIYQIDIFSDKREDVDGIWRELVQTFIENPLIKVHFDGLEETWEFACFITDSDNTSDVNSFTDVGRLWRETITIEVRNASMVFKRESDLAKAIPVKVVTFDSNEFDEEVIQSDRRK